MNLLGEIVMGRQGREPGAKEACQIRILKGSRFDGHVVAGKLIKSLEQVISSQ
jgi:hypothetical protein